MPALADLHAFARSRRDEIIASLRTLVEHESPSRNKSVLDPLAEKIAARFSAAGAQVELVSNPQGGNHVVGRFGQGSERPLLVLGHYDTVWPLNTLAEMPFRVDETTAWGPGIYDMKAGLVIFEYALAAIRAAGFLWNRPLIALWTSDEEIGSPTSRQLIEHHARESACALVLEPPLAGGPLKTSRKGVGQYRLAVQGRAAHAGVEPEKGVNAIVELAHQILSIQALARPELGTTLNVGLIEGGSTPNVVPEHASATIDVRVSTQEESARIEQAMKALRPKHAEAVVQASGGINRPPMERTTASGRLFEQARDIALSLGIALSEGSTGGGSDGNFTSAVGTPTLDGLGADGSGAHASHEQIKIASLLERTALLAALLLELHPDGSDA